MPIQHDRQYVALTSDQHDLEFTGSALVLDPDAAGRSLTGIDPSGRVLPIVEIVLINRSALYPVTIPHNSASSTSGFRFLFPDEQDHQLPPRGILWCVYVEEDVTGWLVEQPPETDRRDGSNALTTTDATPTTLLQWTHPEDTTTWYTVRVIGKSAGGQVGYTRRFAVKRVGSGAPALVSGGTAGGESPEDAGLSSATVNITFSGNDVVVQVTGIAATTFTWAGHAINDFAY